ncbi:MAG: hypothetical protein AAFX99_07385, partial [Myxococcota bacterium]
MDEGTLTTQRVLLLDCQATGASPSRGELLEIGWAVTDARESAKNAVQPETYLVAQPGPRLTIPRRIRALTGITTAEVKAHAISEAAVWQA